MTDKQREKFLQILRDNKLKGNVLALREAGVQGTKRDLRALIDDDLEREAREARGWSLEQVENCTWAVATNTEHPAWDRANARILKAYHPAFQDATRLELTGRNGAPVQIEGRQTSLVEVAAVLARTGALQGLPTIDGGSASRIALPAAPDSLAEPPDS